MHPRVVCNVVYAHLVAAASGEDREKFDADLYAPLDSAGEVDALTLFNDVADEAG